MVELYAEKNQLHVRRKEPLTSGSVNVYEARFSFSPEWEGLSKTAVFRCGELSVSLLLGEEGTCSLPWEVLDNPGRRLYAGVYGTRGMELVLPTVWADLGTVLEGASPGEGAHPPTPDLWEQELAKKGDRMDYTESGQLGLFAGERLLSAVPVQGGGGGTSDHRALTGREAENQHPISSIIKLEETLETIPTAMSADELRKILMS